MIDASRTHAPPGPRAAETGPVEAVVCVPTYRRPAMLAQTLASLAAQRTIRPFRVVIVDNDATAQAGLALAEQALAAGPLRGVALVQPRQGNCHAINAALAAARANFPDAPYLLMIDDDETATPGWIEELVACAERTGADIVGGPVHPRFNPQPRPAIASHPVFWPSYDATGPVPMIHGSGNFLIRQAALARLADPTFHERFNHLGGGDLDFFSRCRRAGLRFHWNNDARIAETVPVARQQVPWILRRGLRIGAINYRVDRRAAASRAATLRVHVKNLALIPVSLKRSALLLVGGKGLLQASHPTIVAAGRLLASVGIEPRPYRASTRP